MDKIPVLLKVSKEFRKCAEEKMPTWLKEKMDKDLWRSVMSYLPVAEIPALLKVSKEFRKCAEEKKLG